MNGLLKSVARQPDINIAEFRSLMFLGVAFIEGTFFMALSSHLLLNNLEYKLEKGEC